MAEPFKALLKAFRDAVRYCAHMAVMPVLASIDAITAFLGRVKSELERI